MQKLNGNDIYEARVVSLINDIDIKTLTLLYQPFIGHLSVALFLTLKETSLLNQAKPRKVEFLTKQLDASLLDLAIAFSRLEAVGLVKTRQIKEKRYNYYFYELYAPFEPKAFFEDVIFSKLLVQYVGSETYTELSRAFMVDASFSEGEDITSTFTEVFNPTLELGDLNIKHFSSGRKTKDIAISFNTDRFLTILKDKYLISESSLDEKEISHIERLATFYHFDEELLASQVSIAFEPSKGKGEKVDLSKLSFNLKTLVEYPNVSKKHRQSKSSQLKGDSLNTQLINLMETLSPPRFLSAQMNNHEIPRSDAILLENLAIKTGLTNGAINALVFWVLVNNNQQLASNYVEKIAGSIKRLELESAADVLDYLEESKKEAKKNTKVSKKPSKAKEELDEVSDEDMDALIKRMEKLNK
jgi:replication initiation and membrane attachment protein